MCSVDICFGVAVARWLENCPMSLFGPAIVLSRVVSAARETFRFPLMIVFGLMMSILSVPITRALLLLLLLLKSGKHISLSGRIGCRCRSTLFGHRCI